MAEERQIHKRHCIKDIILNYGLGEKTVRNAIKSGKLKASKTGRAWFSTDKDISDYFELTSNIKPTERARA